MHKRFFALDGIRGYAAFAVLIGHAIFVYDSGLIRRVLNIPIQSIPIAYEKLIKVPLVIFDGITAVWVFFALSGLVLSIALRKSVLRNSSLLILEFVLKRIARIYPTLIVSLVIFWASRVLLHRLDPDVFSVYGLKNLFDNALLLNPAINGATWTLQVEILAIPFILLCFFLQKRFGLKVLVILLFYLILANDNASLKIPIIPTFLYQSLPPFVCGFFVASEQAEQFFITITKDSRFCIIIFCSFFIVCFTVSPLSLSSILMRLFCISIFLGGIYYRQFTPLLKILESRPSLYLGKISYSFYLNNVIFLYIFHPIFLANFQGKMHPLEFGLLTSVICVVPAIILSHITEKYIEQPSIRFGKAITKFFSVFETKYLTRSVININVSMEGNLQDVVISDMEKPEERD